MLRGGVVFVGDEIRQLRVIDQVFDMEVASSTTNFATVGDLFDAAEVVVTGGVVSAEVDGILSPDVAVGLDDMTRMAVYTVAVDQVFKGDPSATIRTTRTSFVRHGDERRPILLKGVPPNRVGDRMLWFLTSNSDLAEYFQLSISGLVVILDGVIATEVYEDVEGVRKLNGGLADDVFARARTLAEIPESWG